MAFLVVLKRFEVWLLLAVVAGLLLFALSPDGSDPPVAAQTDPTSSSSFTVSKDAPSASESEAEAEAAADPAGEDGLRIESVAVLASGGGAIFETTLAGRSPSGENFVLDEGSVVATTESGEPVSRFFEPFRERSVLSAEGRSAATLRWWLPGGPEALWIEVGENRLRAEPP